MLCRVILTKIILVELEMLVRESCSHGHVNIMGRRQFFKVFGINADTDDLAQFCIKCALDTEPITIDDNILVQMGFKSSHKRNYRRLVKKVMQMKHVIMMRPTSSALEVNEHHRHLCMMGSDFTALLTLLNDNEAKNFWRLISLTRIVLDKYDDYYAKCLRIEKERCKSDLMQLYKRIDAIEMCRSNRSSGDSNSSSSSSSSNNHHRGLQHQQSNNFNFMTVIVSSCFNCFRHYFALCKSYYSQLKMYIVNDLNKC